MEKYEKYVIWATERARLQGIDPQIMGMKLCVNSKLLRTVAKFEIKIPMEELTDEGLHEYLSKCLEPDRYHVPDLDH